MTDVDSRLLLQIGTMNWNHRPYRDEEDFLALLAFLSACNGAAPSAGYIQPGDLIRIPIEPRSFGVQSERSEWEKVRIPGDGRTGGGVPTVR